METQFVLDHDLPYYRAMAAERFGDIDEDDWWCTFAGYDVNVWYEESTGAFKATLYRYDKERGTLTDRWQSLGIIKHKQKGNNMETTNETIEQPKSLHSDLLRIGHLERTIEGLRARIDRDVANFDRFTKDVDAFLQGVAYNHDLEEDDLTYKENLKEWVDRGVLTNPFMSEVTYRVKVMIEKIYDVTVKHPSATGDIDIEDMLEQAFGDADGDPDEVDEDLGESCEITEISKWATDIEVEAKAK